MFLKGRKSESDDKEIYTLALSFFRFYSGLPVACLLLYLEDGAGFLTMGAKRKYSGIAFIL